MEIKIGTHYTASVTVDDKNTASAVGSGLVDVFATPMMIALMELAASECIKPFLDEGQVSVGTMVNVSHVSATPVGMKVFATAEVTETQGRRVEFKVCMRDEAGSIGEGTHTRFIVETEKFMGKANLKIK